MIKILESISNDDYKDVVIKVRDSEKQLEELLNDIKKTANMGHTFDVIVDPNDEHPRAYEIDGDGAFRIDDIKINKTTTEAYEMNDLIKLSDIEGKVTHLDEVALIDIDKRFKDTLDILLNYKDRLSKLYPKYVVDDETPYFDWHAFVAYEIDTNDYFFSEGLDENDKYISVMKDNINMIIKGETAYTCKTLYMEYRNGLNTVKYILNKVK